MKIVIETNGSASGTTISFNGETQDSLKEFNFSIKVGGKAKMQLVMEDPNNPSRILPMSFFGNDFEKYSVKEQELLTGRGVLGKEN